jgi:hypothetical protein
MHCNASDRGINGKKWRRQREINKGNVNVDAEEDEDEDEDEDEEMDLDPFGVDRYMYPSAEVAMIMQLGAADYEYFDDSGYDSEDYRGSGYGFDIRSMGIPVRPMVSMGPFEPNKYEVGSPYVMNNMLIQCRKCKWWNKKKRNMSFRQVNASDWCQACGRVAQVDDFFKAQSAKYTPKKGDLDLGKRNISFRIKGRDPRKIQPFDKNWKKYEGKEEGWDYDEDEMKSDFFRHRVGPRPSTTALLQSISILEESKIPDSGRVSITHEIRGARTPKEEVSGFETEALILDNPNDMMILEELNQYTRRFHEFGPSVLGMDLQAKWDKSSQTGVSAK